jgi:hypothetical protein
LIALCATSSLICWPNIAPVAGAFFRMGANGVVPAATSQSAANALVTSCLWLCANSHAITFIAAEIAIVNFHASGEFAVPPPASGAVANSPMAITTSASACG